MRQYWGISFDNGSHCGGDMTIVRKKACDPAKSETKSFLRPTRMAASRGDGGPQTRVASFISWVLDRHTGRSPGRDWRLSRNVMTLPEVAVKSVGPGSPRPCAEEGLFAI